MNDDAIIYEYLNGEIEDLIEKIQMQVRMNRFQKMFIDGTKTECLRLTHKPETDDPKTQPERNHSSSQR